MEKTGESKTNAEKYLDAVDGDLRAALTSWITAPFGCDYDQLFPRGVSSVTSFSQ